MVKDKIAEALESRFLEKEFEDCFLVDIKESPKTNKIEVFIDSDEGLSYKVLQKISRYLETKIEENAWMPEKYILEVSSPGVDRPLTHLRQYKKNIGRTVELTLADDSKVKGKILNLATDELELEIPLSKKKAKELKKKVENRKIQIKDIMKAIIKLSFKR